MKMMNALPARAAVSFTRAGVETYRGAHHKMAPQPFRSIHSGICCSIQCPEEHMTYNCSVFPSIPPPHSFCTPNCKGLIRVCRPERSQPKSALNYKYCCKNSYSSGSKSRNATAWVNKEQFPQNGFSSAFKLSFTSQSESLLGNNICSNSAFSFSFNMKRTNLEGCESNQSKTYCY